LGGYVDDEGFTYQDKEAYIQVGIFDFCGCDSPLKNLIYIRDMLLKVKNKKIEYMNDRSYVFFLYWANKEGLLEHGWGIDDSCLTERGKEFLKDIEIIIKENSDEL